MSEPALLVGRRYYDYAASREPLSDEEKATLKANLIRYQEDCGVKELVLRDTPEVRRAIRLPDEP